MTLFTDIQSAIRAMKEAPDAVALTDVMQDITGTVGFRWFGLAKMEVGARTPTPSRLTNYPDEWMYAIEHQGRVVDDPVVAASARAVTPFAWRDLGSMLPINARHRQFMDDARHAGLAEGFTVPLHVPGLASGMCSFVVAPGRELPEAVLPSAQYLACFAFEALRRIEAAGGLQPPALTQRQLDCIVLVARGKSDWVAGRLLDLSSETVKSHITEAKRRFNVSTRTELVVRALYHGQIGFSDIGL